MNWGVVRVKVDFHIHHEFFELSAVGDIGDTACLESTKEFVVETVDGDDHGALGGTNEFDIVIFVLRNVDVETDDWGGCVLSG